jgi:hypothetical protein
MNDPRIEKLAYNLINYSCELKKVKILLRISVTKFHCQEH